MLRREPLVAGETYHIYNRGAHKQPVFTSEEDYFRFSLLLHLSNSEQPVHLSNLLPKYQGRSFMKIFEEEKIEDRLVDIFAYCLMPNHFHLVIRQKEEEGIARFMKKLSTAYSMYFNTKYEHSGVLFQGRFKSKHIGSEAYFRYIFSYVHLNPFDIFQPKWKEHGLADKKAARNFLATYPHSSFPDYASNDRAARAILSSEPAADFLKTQNDLEDLLAWQEYQGPSLIFDNAAQPR